MREQWRRYLRFWGPDVGADVDDELSFHVESLVYELEQRGASPDEARRLANERFGNTRDLRRWLRRHDAQRLQRQRGWEIMTEILQDLRYGLRKLLQRPGFSAAVVAVFALGIGATSAIFSVTDAALFRPIAFDGNDRLVVIENIYSKSADFPNRPSALDLDSVRAQTDLFTGVAIWGSGGLNLNDGGEPVRVRVSEVTSNFFTTVGVRPALGRGFVDEEGVDGGPNAVILSDALWRRQFGGDAHVVGRTIHLNDVAYRVAGVMPPGMAFPSGAELWRTMQIPYNNRKSTEAYKGVIIHKALARLAPGVPMARAQNAMFLRYRRDHPEFNSWDPTPDALVRSLRTHLLADQRRALPPLVVGAVLVLLIACANVTNLLLTHGASRRREIALRTVLGASRGRVVRQLLVETLVLAAAGALAGLVIARLSLSALTPVLPRELTLVNPPQVDGRVFLLALSAALATGVVFGLWPALGASKTELADAMKSGGEFGSTRRSLSLTRGVLVVSELALALMLLVGAGLMFGSFRTLMAVDAGFRTDHVMTMELSLPRARYASDAAEWAFYQSLFDRLRSTPGVVAAGSSNVLPLSEDKGFSIAVRPEGSGGGRNDGPSAHWLVASPGYFEALGVTLIAGRTFVANEDTAQHPVIINQYLADKLWPGETNAVGRRIDAMGAPLTVIGVVGNVRTLGLDRRLLGAAYQPMATSPRPYSTIVVRGTIDARTLGARMRDAVRSIDRTIPVYNVRAMGDVVSASVVGQRTRTLLIVAFGLVALALAAVGVYGVLAFAVAQRTRELGIRMALGARSAEVRGMVLSQGVRLAALGTAIGLAGAFVLSRFIANQLFGVTATDPRTYMGATLVLFVIAVIATYLPARRATTVDPMVALRSE